MKIVKLSATALGAIVAMLSLNSCAKKQECCTMKYTYDSYSVSSKACEDGTYETKMSYAGESYSYSGNWEEDYSWDEVKVQGNAYAVFYSGTFECEDEKI